MKTGCAVSPVGDNVASCPMVPNSTECIDVLLGQNRRWSIDFNDAEHVGHHVLNGAVLNLAEAAGLLGLNGGHEGGLGTVLGVRAAVRQHVSLIGMQL